MPSPEERSNDSRIERARKGSLSAMNRLFASCRTALRRQAKALFPRSLARKLDVSDLVQECHLLAADQFGAFNGRSRPEFLSWLWTILDRVILQQLRYFAQKKRDQKREEPLAADGGVAGEPAESTASNLSQLVRAEECEQMMVALGWCHEEDQAVIFKHLFEYRSYEEIAAEWGVTCKAVRKRFSRAVRCVGKAMRLQALMIEHGIPEDQQEVIGIHQCQRTSTATISTRLELPEWLVALWLDEARPLIREFDEDKS